MSKTWCLLTHQTCKEGRFSQPLWFCDWLDTFSLHTKRGACVWTQGIRAAVQVSCRKSDLPPIGPMQQRGTNQFSDRWLCFATNVNSVAFFFSYTQPACDRDRTMVGQWHVQYRSFGPRPINPQPKLTCGAIQTLTAAGWRGKWCTNSLTLSELFRPHQQTMRQSRQNGRVVLWGRNTVKH